MNKKCLITGAKGFVGSNVLEYLLKNTDWDIACIVRGFHSSNNPRVNVITHDLCKQIPYIGDFDYIVNLASKGRVDESIKEPVSFIENNVESTLRILEYARNHPPKVFLQFSTDEVYGTAAHDSWDVLLPSSPYAASKAAQDMVAIAYWKTYRVPVVIVNSNNIIGKNQNSANFVPKIIELIRNDEMVDIYTINGKPGKRYWNSVNNVSSAIHFILQINPAMYPICDRPDKYSVGGGRELDNLQMAQLIAKRLRKPLSYKLIDAEAVRPGYNKSYAKVEDKLGKLGWLPVEKLEESLTWI